MACCLVADVAMCPEVQGLLAGVVPKSAQGAQTNPLSDDKFLSSLERHHPEPSLTVPSPCRSPPATNFIMTI
jgi:hypothetical protein